MTKPGGDPNQTRPCRICKQPVPPPRLAPATTPNRLRHMRPRQPNQSEAHTMRAPTFRGFVMFSLGVLYAHIIIEWLTR